MGFQTVRQISLEYGISARMLRYYEQVGLIESSRKDDYAYRVYGSDAIKRLQQIIILRKLQIPIKQISDILINRDAVTVIEIFKQNINQLDEKITALSSVKSILEHFVNDLHEKANVHVTLDLLNDKTMIAVAESLSIPVSKVKGKISMEELNKASETINKSGDSKVRIVFFPPMTIAGVSCAKYTPDRAETYLVDNAERIVDPYQQFSLNMRAMIKQFIDDMDLFKMKPDARIFGFGNEEQNSGGHWSGDYQMWVTIPDDLEVSPPFKKMKFNGGLYAACANCSAKTDHGYMIHEWLERNDEYEWDPEGGVNRPAMDEYINLFNRHGLKNAYSDEIGFMYLDALVPIKEKVILPDGEKKRREAESAKLDTVASQGESVDIDLTTMIRYENDTGFFFDVTYSNGLMAIRADGENHGGMATPRQFSCPLKIELRAKTNDTNITIKYGNGLICFNWEYIRSSLLVFDISTGSFHCFEKCGEVPINEFVNIEWVIGREETTVKVNGELRHFGSDYEYIKAFRESTGYRLSSAVTLQSGYGSTVTGESDSI